MSNKEIAMSEKDVFLLSVGVLAGVGIVAGAIAIHRWWRDR